MGGPRQDVSDMSRLWRPFCSASFFLPLFLYHCFTCCQHAIVIGHYKVQIATKDSYESQCTTFSQQVIQYGE